MRGVGSVVARQERAWALPSPGHFFPWKVSRPGVEAETPKHPKDGTRPTPNFSPMQGQAPACPA